MKRHELDMNERDMFGGHRYSQKNNFPSETTIERKIINKFKKEQRVLAELINFLDKLPEMSRKRQTLKFIMPNKKGVTENGVV